MLRYQNFGAGFTASRSFNTEMNGYQFDTDLRMYLTPPNRIKNEFYMYGRGSYTTFNWIQPEINMNLRNKVYEFASVGLGYRHSFGKRKNLFYEFSFGVKVYQLGKVTHDTIIPQGMHPVEARLMIGYQWKNTTTKKVSENKLRFTNHKISISNPLGAMAKVRLRYELHKYDKSLLLAGSVNYFALSSSGLDSTQHKTNVGWQVYLEGRKYRENNNKSFLYAKAGLGRSTLYDFAMNYNGYYSYNLLGAGFGYTERISPRFFYEYNFGAKWCYGDPTFNANYRTSASEILGVMSVVDANVHIGMYINSRLYDPTLSEEDYIPVNRRFYFKPMIKKVLRFIFWMWV